jgi:hypothetical protein
MTPAEQTRQELLAALNQLGRLRPDWRLGQTLANLAMIAGRTDAGGVWDLDDDEALAAARHLIEQSSVAAAEA